MDLNAHGVRPHEGSADTLDESKLAALRQLVGDDAGTLRELVDAFVEDAPAQIRELRDGISAGDAVVVRRAAHTLKSNGLTFGAVALADVCREIEEAAQEHRLENVSALADRVEETWRRARPAIEGITP